MINARLCLIICIVILAFSACNNNQTEEPIPKSEILMFNDSTLIKFSSLILEKLANKEFDYFIELSNDSVLLSPYCFVDVSNCKTVNSELLEDESIHFFGIEDGSGDSLNLTFNQYYGRYIYNKNYLKNAVVSTEKFNGSGNMVNNIKKVFHNSKTVEYYMEGQNPEFIGMDWSSLILVIEEKVDGYMLKAIIHNEHTM